LGAVAVTVEGSLTVVAKQRFCARSEGREESKSAEAIKRLVGGLIAAMAVYVDVFRIRRGGVGVEVIECCAMLLRTIDDFLGSPTGRENSRERVRPLITATQMSLLGIA
jgi:hypothetical protein